MPSVSLKRPARCELVVFDRYATQGILPLLPEFRHVIFENRRTQLHLWALVKMFARLRCSWIDYCIAYLQLTGASVVVTGVDSNPLFYRLKHRLPGVSFVAVQNGIRGTGSPVKAGDLWTALASHGAHRPSVDVVATFGTAHSNQFREHIDCQTIEVGSTRSNAIPISEKPATTIPIRIALISNFSGLPHVGVFDDGTVDEMAMYLGERPVTAREYFSADAHVASTLSRICEREGWDFTVVGRRDASFGSERRFFEEACRGSRFSFVPKTSEESSYVTLDMADLVVSIDSTLGYEMIARGQRVLFVQARAELLGGSESRQFAFGFPGTYPNEGEFWTRSLDAGHITAKMHELLALSDTEWVAASRFVASELMAYDSNNERLSALLNSLLTVRRRGGK
ncbi:MAG: LA_1612 family putative O-antigen biosynthesis protein [Ilumatobacteraceae bacterium]